MITILSFTDTGDRLNREIADLLSKETEIRCSLQSETDDSLSGRTEKAFKSDAVIFIGAAGIAVRAIAPFITKKDRDPAVIVMDELKQHVIPVLSGHIGGGNKLAERIAELTGAEAVITTATDINEVFAVDNWAVERDYKIENTERIKDVSASLLRGDEIGVSISPYLTDIFPKQLKLTPKCLVIGAGCKKGVPYEDFRDFILAFLNDRNISLSAVSDLATLDIKRDEECLRRFAREYNLNISYYGADELKELPDRFDFSVSEFVEREIGVSNVCERSAVKRAMELGRSDGVKLLEKKVSDAGMTAAIAVYDPEKNKLPGKIIYVAGLGPGCSEMLTLGASSALEKSEVIIGYKVYTDMAARLSDLNGKTIIPSEMRHERERCEQARDLALSGKSVSLVCSGDSGIYGMAGLLYEVCDGFKEIEIEVIPGITAALGGAAMLGSPLTNDFCVISLSDHLTPMETILKRIRAAAEADLAMVLYNPRSKTRPGNLREACSIMLELLPPDRVCGYVKNIGREGQVSKIFTLDTIPYEEIDMFTTVFIGNSMTKVINGKMVTLRGYRG
ncbi:MAG: precorrin-3B C(17)-methyltransferase [Lachnospiraceae bacterium]|nr:precorrin-3B C(17)-methyltransferase [Lachnospiraceae bacterium]